MIAMRILLVSFFVLNIRFLLAITLAVAITIATTRQSPQHA
jgi:hypothetical protein